MNSSMKELRVSSGPRHNRQEGIVQLNGVSRDEKLTPKMARQALRIAGYIDGEVWEMAQYDAELGDFDYDSIYGYRIYAKSARKLTPDF